MAMVRGDYVEATACTGGTTERGVLYSFLPAGRISLMGEGGETLVCDQIGARVIPLSELGHAPATLGFIERTRRTLG